MGTVAHPVRFFEPTEGRGKWHAAWRVDGTAVCGAPAILDTHPQQPAIVPEVGTPWERVHPLVCRRCLRLATSSGYANAPYTA